MKINQLAQKAIVITIFISLLFSFFPTAVAARGKKENSVTQTCCPVVALKNSDFFPALLKAIDEAREEIFISMFFFRAGVHKRSYPDRIVVQLSRAVKRGVKVKVILENTGKTNDELSTQNRETKKLLEEQGVVVFLDSPKQRTHTKLIVIDQRLVLLGSHNLTQSGLKHNNEISLLVESPELARELREYMLALIEEAK